MASKKAQPGYGPQPSRTRFETTTDPSLYGRHVPYNKGTNVALPNIEAGRGRHSKTWNAVLIDSRGTSVALWVHDWEASFEMSGQNVQSRRRRQFFPHNFTQPKVVVKGMVPNNYQYNRLAAFVRSSHFWALWSEELARLERNFVGFVSGRHMKDGAAVPTVQLWLRGDKASRGRSTKGPNRPWRIDGYISRIQAGAQQHKFATEFEFEFTVAYSRRSGQVGLYQDTWVSGSKLATWMDVFKKWEESDARVKQTAAFSNALTNAALFDATTDAADGVAWGIAGAFGDDTSSGR